MELSWTHHELYSFTKDNPRDEDHVEKCPRVSHNYTPEVPNMTMEKQPFIIPY